MACVIAWLEGLQVGSQIKIQTIKYENIVAKRIGKEASEG